MTDAPTPTDESWNPERRVRDLSVEMVGWRSETGTQGEAEFTGRLEALMREIPYFRDHPDHIAVFDSHGVPPRRNLVALVKGRGRRALALAGHFDTAAIDNYRELAHLACEPEALRQALIADLSSRARTEQEERALADLVSGDFLPGRAMLDMKSGIAAGIALLERHAERESREGSLLLIATPDEERNSRGMRALRDALPALAARWDVAIAGAVNLDATSDQGDGSEGRAAYAGTIGKLLPFAFVVGEPAHAAYPFDGVSTHLLASAILARVETNTALCDRGGTEVSPPPICLEGRDLRGGYEVTTPERAFLAFNWLYHSWRPAELMERFRAEVEAGLRAAVSRFEAEAERYAELAGRRRQGRMREPRVLAFADLRAMAAEAGGEAALARLDAFAADLLSLDNPLEKTRRLVEACVEEARLGGPAAVIGFSSLHYPHTHLDPTAEADRALLDAVEAARETAGRLGAPLAARDTFLGISDMSFLGHAPDASESDLVAHNTPAPDLVDRPAGTPLRFPVVNIGPWGRDYHQRLERVHAPYAFRDLPLILDALTRRFLGA
ncbi:M20/M25/M40 family metallo-hydrolase [Antarcticirhabdus aurantiaca]|uniref:M20/M25/M40 family metallo-hydrolase n=1 Tax=Antarcticirhabdus aurantiaca TaxID=2606717 RepID=A0ACD4NPH2_9HYPH|nr:M20/M25/M40 family metallo-hydrolase [Antarcticirhabdus aurantiaca]WAJ28791.1 M20/M25/M40 family metallo-hydrolase [Jeongeuplla avenae]